jgi:diacylglycerol kinase (ATP)
VTDIGSASSSLPVTVIVNPISGTGRRSGAGRERAEHAAAALLTRGRTSEVFVTERRGHAHELAAAARARGARLIFVWGGDGTVNEVASALAYSDVVLAIMPAGSGNGLARELGIPRDPAGAVGASLTGHARLIDAGELGGHLFFNVAGYGLDARVAHLFSAPGAGRRRGLRQYLRLAARELLAYEPYDCTVSADGVATETRALIVAIANARQYGNGALVAPRARLDDGRLDLVVIRDRSPWVALAQAPLLFAGQLARVPGVTMTRVIDLEIRAKGSMLYHVDGETHTADGSVRGRVRPGALRVLSPVR